MAWFRSKSSVDPKKRKIIEQADKDIQDIRSMETERTKTIKAATGAESDIDIAARERAKKARREMTMLNGRKK